MGGCKEVVVVDVEGGGRGKEGRRMGFLYICNF